MLGNSNDAMGSSVRGSEMKIKKGLEVIEEKKEPRTPTTANKLKLFKALNPPQTTAKLNFTVCTSMCRSELELI